MDSIWLENVIHVLESLLMRDVFEAISIVIQNLSIAQEDNEYKKSGNLTNNSGETRCLDNFPCLGRWKKSKNESITLWE